MNLFTSCVVGMLLLRGSILPNTATLVRAMPKGLAAALISGLTATPSTIAFSATDPDLGSVSGTPSTVTWSALAGLPTDTWTLTVQAAASAFLGCSTVPTSAVTVRCTSAAATGTGGSGTCAGPFTLSAAPQQVASGKEGLASGNYTVLIAFTLADSWRYVAALAPACTITLTYAADTP